MIVNLIKSKQMFSLTLPNKVKGQYWLSDVDHEGNARELPGTEAVTGEWVLKCNKKVSVLNSNNEPVINTVLHPSSFFNLKVKDDSDRVILFSEKIDRSRQVFFKVVAKEAGNFGIGRTNDNNFCYENKFVSSKHARLSFDGKQWSITDLESTNGTYVNGYRIMSSILNPGDLIYIMGLKMIIGHNYIAVNNPDSLLKVHAKNGLSNFYPQNVTRDYERVELPEKQYFFRSPRFHREVKHAAISIDSPPQLQKQDTVPMALMLGPSLTMGMTSMSTGIFTVSNVISNGGSWTQAAPSLIMSGGMLLGTVLWPILTKKYEKKARQKNEKKRQEKYLAYLEGIRDEIKRIGKEQSDILKENIVSIEECANRIANEQVNLWERSIGQKDFLRLRLGKGNTAMDIEVKYPEKKFTMDDDNLQDAMQSLGTEPKVLREVPISVSLVDNFTVGIYGNYTETVNMLQSLLLQMISLHSYDELKMVFICDSNDEKVWNFVRFIPHFWDDEHTIRFFACVPDDVKEISSYIDKIILDREENTRREDEFSPHYVIISTSKSLTEKSESIQKLLKCKKSIGFSILLVAAELKDLPKETKFVIHANQDQSRMFDRKDTTGKGISFVQEAISRDVVERVSSKIANIELDLSSQQYALPSMITFLEMFNVGKIEHLNSLTRWKENNPTISLQTPIGVDSYGNQFNLDLHEKFHGPHGLVAGMTGSGKSEFIITYILSLAVNYHPDEVAFILIDYKGGGLTGAFEDPDRGIKLPHLAGTITNLDGAAVQRSLISIQSELRRRQAIFNEARRISNEGTMDIYKYQQLYRDKVVSEPVPHLFIISDEFAELKTQQPEFMDQLISTARIGRSLGVHLILATQKPSGVVDDQIWSNSKFRVCLKVQEKADSQDMIKCPDAAELSQTGRFYLQVGFNELFALGQSAWCGAKYIPTETVEKTVDDSVRVIDNLGRVLMNAKMEKKQTFDKGKTKQVVAIVKYLSDLAAEENIHERPLWLDPIPSKIYIDMLEKKYVNRSKGIVLNPIIGEYDDPFNQKQGVLTMPFSAEGNCLVYGSTGNGKTTFLTTLCYSLIRNHSADEVNIYIMDFGSETLTAFDQAPQVGGVIVSSDEEKVVNFLKMMTKEMDYRKNLFSAYGGDLVSYCKNSGKQMPNIVVVLNNYAGFAEEFEDYLDAFTLLTRDGVKYGIYFAVTASNTNDVRYKAKQNFKQMFTMQLNDATDYSIVVGKTEGLVPSKFKGRGLVALDRVYEFQTAYCKDVPDTQEYIREYCNVLKANATAFAKRIPVLPEIVDLEYLRPAVKGIKKVPVGVNKKTLTISSINLEAKVVYPIAAQDMADTLPFVRPLVKEISSVCKTIVWDPKDHLHITEDKVAVIQKDSEQYVQELFAEMVERNNVYKDAQCDASILDHYEERIYVIMGIKTLYDQLTDDGKEKLALLLEKGESIYKLHFVIIDSITEWNVYTYEAWYKRHINGSEGIWIGDGVTEQYLMKTAKISRDMYEEVEEGYGYVFAKKQPSLVKLLFEQMSEERDEDE